MRGSDGRAVAALLSGVLILIALLLVSVRTKIEDKDSESGMGSTPGLVTKKRELSSGEGTTVLANENQSSEITDRLAYVGGKNRSDEFVSLSRVEGDEDYRYRVIRHKNVRSYLNWQRRNLPESQTTLKLLIKNGYDIESWRGAYLSASKVQAVHQKFGGTPAWERVGPVVRS